MLYKAYSMCLKVLQYTLKYKVLMLCVKEEENELL